jgi:hypothetical protein
MMTCEFTSALKRGGCCCAILKLCGVHDAGLQRNGLDVKVHRARRRRILLSLTREWLRVSGEMTAGFESGCGCFGFCVQMRVLLAEAATSTQRVLLLKVRWRLPAWESVRHASLPERDGSLR